MSQAGYRFSESQLDRWVARVNAGEAAVSTTKATGPLVHLARELRDIAGGWLLSQNLRGVSVHRLDYSNFCNEQFGLTLSKQTVSRYLAEDGFSYRTMQSKAKGFIVDVRSQRHQLWDWVQTLCHEGIFDVHRSLLASIDFTFDLPPYREVFQLRESGRITTYVGHIHLAVHKLHRYGRLGGRHE